MARYSAGVRTGAGSTVLPIISLYSAAATTGTIVEIGVFNTTSTAVALKLMRLTTTGTQGAALTSSRHNPKLIAAACTAYTTHTVAPTLGNDLGYRTTLGALVGSGVIWTFGGGGIMVAAADAVEAVTNGVGLIVATGTGQVCDAWIVWEE